MNCACTGRSRKDKYQGDKYRIRLEAESEKRKNARIGSIRNSKQRVRRQARERSDSKAKEIRERKLSEREQPMRAEPQGAAAHPGGQGEVKAAERSQDAAPQELLDVNGVRHPIQSVIASSASHMPGLMPGLADIPSS